MAFGDTFGNDLLQLILDATAIANVADNAASAPLTSVYISLHTADPTSAGDQTSSECAYTSYARVAIARSGSGWAISGKTANPAAEVSFPAATGGTETATHAAIGTATSGAGKIIAIGALSPTIAIATGVTPKLTTATAFTLT